MPDILAKPPFALWAVLILLTVIPIGIAFFFGGASAAKAGEKKPSSRKWFFVTSGIGLLLLLGLFICYMTAAESDQRQIERKMKEMSDGVHEQDLDKVFRHVSANFMFQQSNRATLRQQAETRLRQGDVTEIPIWDVLVEPITDGLNATVQFKFKVKGRFDNGVGYVGKAYFIRDPD